MASLSYGKSLIPRPLAALAGLSVILLAAGGGWLAAERLATEPASVPPPPAVSVRTGPAELELRAGWRLDPKVPRVPGLDAEDAKALAPADGGRGRMVVAVLPEENGELPRATVDALRVPLGTSERSTVGGIRGVGYSALSLRGVNGLADLYTFRTAGGLLAISCIAPIDDPLPVDSCPGDVTSIAVAVPPPPDPAAKLKAALPDVTAKLNRERTSGRIALRRGAHSDAQARAALDLWRAYREAGGAVAAVAPKSGEGAKIAPAMREAARAYRALGVAASRHSERGWARARRDVTAAEKAVAARLASLGT
jgi:hypothetical protein